MGAVDVGNPSLERTLSGTGPRFLPLRQRHSTSASSRSLPPLAANPGREPRQGMGGFQLAVQGAHAQSRRQVDPGQSDSKVETYHLGSNSTINHSRTPSGDDHCTVLVLLPDSSVHIFSQPGSIKARDVLASLPPSHRLLQITSSHDATRGFADETHYCECSRRTLDQNESLRHGETYFSVPSKDAVFLLDPVAVLYNGNKVSPRTNAVRAYFPGRGPCADDCMTSAGAGMEPSSGGGRSGEQTCSSVGCNDADGSATLPRLTLQDVGIAVSVLGGIAASASGGISDESSSSSFPLLPRRSSTEAHRGQSRLPLGLPPLELQSRRTSLEASRATTLGRVSMQGSRSKELGQGQSDSKGSLCSELSMEMQGAGLSCSSDPKAAREHHTCEPVPRCGSESLPPVFARQTNNWPSSRIARPRYFQRRLSSEVPSGMPDKIPKSFSSPRSPRRLSVDAALAWNRAVLAKTDPAFIRTAEPAVRLAAPSSSDGPPAESSPLRSFQACFRNAAETQSCSPQQSIGTDTVAPNQSLAAVAAQGAGQVPAQASMSEWLQESSGLRTRGGSSKLKGRFKDFDLWLTQSDSPRGQGQNPPQEQGTAKQGQGQGQEHHAGFEAQRPGNAHRGRKSLSEAAPVGGLTRRLSGVFSGSRASGPELPSVPLEGVGGSRTGLRGRRRHRLSLQGSNSGLQAKNVPGHTNLDIASGVPHNVSKESPAAQGFQQEWGSKQEALGQCRPLPSIVEKPQPSKGSSLLRTVSLGLLGPKKLGKLQSTR